MSRPNATRQRGKRTDFGRRLPADLNVIPTHVIIGDGVADDTMGLRSYGAGFPVVDANGRPIYQLRGLRFMLREPFVISRRGRYIADCHVTATPDFHEFWRQLAAMTHDPKAPR